MTIWEIRHVRTWAVIDGHWVTPGVYRRRPGQTPKPLRGWRIAAHRALWGFGQGWVDAR